MSAPAAARPKGPFTVGGMLALVLAGSAVFLLLLYAIGAGWTGNGNQTATETADSNALNGFSALAELLERRGHGVTSVRGRLSQGFGEWDEQLLVLTPGLYSDPAELARKKQRGLEFVAQRPLAGETGHPFPHDPPRSEFPR